MDRKSITKVPLKAQMPLLHNSACTSNRLQNPYKKNSFSKDKSRTSQKATPPSSQLFSLFVLTSLRPPYDRELLSQHQENTRTLMHHIIYNELSSSKNPNNMNLLSVMFQQDSKRAAWVSYCFSLLFFKSEFSGTKDTKDTKLKDLLLSYFRRWPRYSRTCSVTKMIICEP